MPTQTEIDTAGAKAKQNNNNQAAKDTARAKSKQNGGDGGTANDFSAREAAAGLNLAGNSTISAGRGGVGPTFSDREVANGLSGTTAGRDDFYSFTPAPKQPWSSFDSSTFEAGLDMAFKADEAQSPDEANYAFKVVDDGDGSVSVTTGTVNTSTATGLTPSGKPTELWLRVTFDTDGEVTGAVVSTTAGTTSETLDSRLIASITWDGDSPTIVQGIKGSQSIASCGETHQWGTLYS